MYFIKLELIKIHFRLSRNANESLSEQRLHRLEDYAYTHSGQVLAMSTHYLHYVVVPILSVYSFVTIANTSATLRPMI